MIQIITGLTKYHVIFKIHVSNQKPFPLPPNRSLKNHPIKMIRAIEISASGLISIPIAYARILLRLAAIQS